jgi:ATP-dependent exoDNAse (exonuclease V) beta subunit
MKYKEQIRIYRDGAKRIFNTENVECYIVNLPKAQIIPIDF